MTSFNSTNFRVALLAGLFAGTVVTAAPPTASVASQFMRGFYHIRSAPEWTPPLGDPVQAARGALERGDSALVAVVVHDSTTFPGATEVLANRIGSNHEYSRRRTRMSEATWRAFVPRVREYAAAYNAVIRIAVDSRTREGNADGEKQAASPR